jgi:hypothetical protein
MEVGEVMAAMAEEEAVAKMPPMEEEGATVVQQATVAMEVRAELQGSWI